MRDLNFEEIKEVNGGHAVEDHFKNGLISFGSGVAIYGAGKTMGIGTIGMMGAVGITAIALGGAFVAGYYGGQGLMRLIGSGVSEKSLENKER